MFWTYGAFLRTNPRPTHMRYQRHLQLPAFEARHQAALAQARVLVVGAGGLGVPAAQYLAGAGIGELVLMDADRIETTNLHRQPVYHTAQVGELKGKILAQQLRALNPEVTVTVLAERCVPANARQTVHSVDIVLDCSDNFPTRYLLNDACVLEGKPLVYGSVFQYSGQVAVFNGRLPDGSRGPNYRDLFPQPDAQLPDCNSGGVLGPLVGALGALQAAEALKVLAGIGEPLHGRVLLMDAFAAHTRTVRFSPDPANPLRGTPPAQQDVLPDYGPFCGVTIPHNELTASALLAALAGAEPPLVVDVRAAHETCQAPLPVPHVCIPLPELPQQLAGLPRSRPMVLVCEVGRRSATGVALLQERGFSNAQSLAGGRARLAALLPTP